MLNNSSIRRTRRTSYLDRAWLDHWTVLALFPITPPDVSELRAKMAAFMHSDPTHTLCCTLDDDGRRWRPVAPQDRQRHLEDVIVSGGQLDPADPYGYLRRFRPAPDTTAPFKVVIGPDSASFYFAHVVGDAAVFSPFSVLMALGEVESLRQLQSDAGLRDAAKMLLKEFRPHWRDWRDYMRSGDGLPATPAPDTTSLPQAAAPDTEAVATLVSAEQFAALKAWRKAHCPDTSMTALMTSATYLALAEQGIPISRDGYYTLVDTRRHLPKDQALRPGNLAKSAYVAADLGDPGSVAASMKKLVDSARAVPALVSGALSAGRRNRVKSAESGGGPITMTFNSMMRNPGIERIPWISPASGRYVGMSYPVGPTGMSIFASGIQDRVEFAASFDANTIDPRSVQAALDRLHDMPSLLDRAVAAPREMASIVVPAGHTSEQRPTDQPAAQVIGINQ